MSTSVQYSIDNPQDPNVKTTFTKNDHGRIMSSLKSIATKYKLLGNEFCIPKYKIEEIDDDNRGKRWDCLDGIVSEWLKWNFKDDVKGKVKPNVDWLIRAVRAIDDELAKKLEAEFWVETSDGTNDITHTGSKERAQLKQETFDTTTTGPSNNGSSETEATDYPSASNAGFDELKHRTSHTAAHDIGTKDSDKSVPLKPSAKRPNHLTYENWSKLKMCAVGLVLLGVISLLVGYLVFKWYSTQGLVIYTVLLVVMFILISVGYLVFKWYSTQGLVMYAVLVAVIYVLISVGYLVFDSYSTQGLVIYAAVPLAILFVVAKYFSIWEFILTIVILGPLIMVFIWILITSLVTWTDGGDITKLKPLITLVDSVISSAFLTPIVSLVYKNLEGKGHKTKTS
ncbi:PREDICTED: uncharacterized protein LOC109585485 [Amphimedon queenslandica]|uniref:Uncharacterized protein n=1 Tax=Amphimedon queenslandica TaxID=400682 RepID=A0AAN0JK48_AMPQE|nr:PREDICTED: uncharacterized protein LOC109585485 [Amphimedon queenslandica]|eukprot:XP_019857142.1 PREDICTED: uncharacterized protein LOC109585485 [Amphimedon queenslandica]